MAIDWELLENVLCELAEADIRSFSQTWPEERIYGFAFDCNSQYGDLFLCANTEQTLRETAKQYASGNTPNAEVFDKLSEKLGIEPKQPSNDVEAEIEDLRWSLGDWKYQGFESQAFEDGWEKHGAAVRLWCLDYDEEKDPETFMTPAQVEFMHRACRAMVRLEKENAFDILNRTNDFSTWVSDHDEPEESAWDRLNEVRREMLKGQ